MTLIRQVANFGCGDIAIERQMALAIIRRRFTRVVIDPSIERTPRNISRFLDRPSYANTSAFLIAAARERAIRPEDIVELNRRITLVRYPEKRSDSYSARRHPEFATRFPYDPGALDMIAGLLNRPPGQELAAEVFLTTIAKHPFFDGNGRIARLLAQHVLRRHFRNDTLDLPLGVASSANIDVVASAVRRRLRGEPCDDFTGTFGLILLACLQFLEFELTERESHMPVVNSQADQ